MPTVAPGTGAELADLIADARARGARLELRGGASKAGIGRPARDVTAVDMRGFAGVVDYDPAELVLTVRAGTRLAEIEALVAGERQMLAFEPFDHAPLFGAAPGAATIGGIVAAGVGGSRRLVAGGVRDHLLGFAGVSGRGEAFVAGAKVVKNVTGYDLPKVAAGSWGRLMALTEVTLKVMPAPQRTATRVVAGLSPGQAYAAMAAAMGSQADVSAAAHLPGSPSRTAFRMQGFGPSVAARCASLERLLGEHAAVDAPDEVEAAAIWAAVRTLDPLGRVGPLWRVSIPARAFPTVAALLDATGARWLADWAGGLVWAAFAGDPAIVRAAAARAGGHATLVRGGGDLPAVPTFQPRPDGLAALEARVRRAFDPDGVFETGRFGDADAD